MIALAIVALLTWAARPDGDAGGPLVYVEDATEIDRYVQLGRKGILTSENFVGHRIRIVEGSIHNVADQPIRSVELLLSFRGVGGEAVLESAEQAVSVPLAPGQEGRYVFRFENLPPEWDYRVPDVTILRVGF